MPNGDVVAFVVTDETAVRRKVKTALEAGGAVAVESGIQAGEMVVTRGNEMLKDGAKVQVAGQKKNEPPLAPTSQNKPQKEANP
jgi:hypothetical protein